MLWSNAFGCGPGYVVDHSSTEKWSAFRAPSLPAFSQDGDTREVALKTQVHVAQSMAQGGQRSQPWGSL